jgi:hypothetical protein
MLGPRQVRVGSCPADHQSGVRRMTLSAPSRTRRSAGSALALVLLLAPGLALMAACGRNGDEPVTTLPDDAVPGAGIVGTYEFDPDATARRLEAALAQARDEAEAFGLEMLLETVELLDGRVTLDANGKASMAIGDLEDAQTFVGTWTSTGGRIVIELALEGDEPEVLVASLDGDELVLSNPEDDESPAMVFRRVARR